MTIGKDLGGEQGRKTGRIGPNPGVYDHIEPNWDEIYEENIPVGPSCPLGFTQKNSSVTEICSDVDEEGLCW